MKGTRKIEKKSSMPRVLEVHAILLCLVLVSAVCEMNNMNKKYVLLQHYGDPLCRTNIVKNETVPQDQCLPPDGAHKHFGVSGRIFHCYGSNDAVRRRREDIFAEEGNHHLQQHVKEERDTATHNNNNNVEPSPRTRDGPTDAAAGLCVQLRMFTSHDCTGAFHGMTTQCDSCVFDPQLNSYHSVQCSSDTKTALIKLECLNDCNGCAVGPVSAVVGTCKPYSVFSFKNSLNVTQMMSCPEKIAERIFFGGPEGTCNSEKSREIDLFDGVCEEGQGVAIRCE